MVRPTWANLPSDENKVPRHIDRILEGSEAASVQEVLRCDKLRDLQFTSANYRKEVALSSFVTRLAAAIQQRGDTADPCDCCREGKDLPFVGCIAMSDHGEGKCGNCIYRHKRCSLGNSEFA